MYCLFMRYVLTVGVMGLLSCLLAVSNSEPATRSEMSHAYRSSYLTAPLNSLGKTYQGGEIIFQYSEAQGWYICIQVFIHSRSKSHLAVQSADVIFRCLRGQNAVEFGLHI